LLAVASNARRAPLAHEGKTRDPANTDAAIVTTVAKGSAIGPTCDLATGEETESLIDRVLSRAIDEFFRRHLFHVIAPDGRVYGISA
jgi:hypothetical protein